MNASRIQARIGQLRADDFAVSISFDPIDVKPGASGDELIRALGELGYSEFGPQLVRGDEPCASVGPPTIAAMDISVSHGANAAVVTGWPTASATGGSSALDLHLGSGVWHRPDWLESLEEDWGFVPTPKPQSWTWLMDDGRLVAHPLGGGVQSVDISRDGAFAVATETYANSEPLLTVFDLRRGGTRRSYLGLGAVEQNVTGQVRLSRDDRWALLGSGPGLVHLESQRLFQLPRLRGTFDWDPQAAAGLVGIVLTGTTTACIVRVDLTTGEVTRGPDLARDESCVPWHGEYQRCIGFSVNAAGTTALALTEFGVGPDARGKVHGCAAGVVDLRSGVVGRALPVMLDHPVARFVRSPQNPRWLRREDAGRLGTIDESHLTPLTGGPSDPASDVYAGQAQFLREIDLDVTARWLLRSIMDGHAIRLGMPGPPVRDLLLAYDLLYRTGNSAGLDELVPQVTNALVQRDQRELAGLIAEGVEAIRGGGPGRTALVQNPGGAGGSAPERKAPPRTERHGALLAQLERDAPGSSAVLAVEIGALADLEPERIAHLFAARYLHAGDPTHGPRESLSGIPALLALMWDPAELVKVNADVKAAGTPAVRTLAASAIEDIQLGPSSEGPLSLVTVVAGGRAHVLGFHADGYARYFAATLSASRLAPDEGDAGLPGTVTGAEAASREAPRRLSRWRRR